MTSVIYNKINDTNGFIGYLPSDKSIYVAFRGSESISNWISDLNADKDPYRLSPECNCSVHSGFQNCTESVSAQVLAEVKRLKALYPTYSVKTTGHSLGGALAQMTAMMLIKNGIPTTMINFGQPRVGDKDYAAYSNSVFPNQYRHVHHQDMVPHNPTSGLPYYYWHTAYEMYEDKAGTTIKQCNSSGEDPSCSDGINILLLGIDDHLVYLGKCMSSTCGQCAAFNEVADQ